MRFVSLIIGVDSSITVPGYGTLSASSDTHNLHIFSSFPFFVRSRLASGLARKKKLKERRKEG